MPDAVAVVTAYLRDALTAHGQLVPVVSRVPSPRPPTFVRVRRLGGVQQTPVSDRPRLDVHCWAESESAAHDLAALCRALLGDIPGVRGCQECNPEIFLPAQDPYFGAGAPGGNQDGHEQLRNHPH